MIVLKYGNDMSDDCDEHLYGFLCRMFQGVQSKGQPAVDAINGFEQVVQLLNQALQMALDANNTMQRTLSQLQSISVSSIEASANQSLAASQAIKQSIDLLVANVSTFGENRTLTYSVFYLISSLAVYC